MNYIFGFFCILISPVILLFAAIKTLYKEAISYKESDKNIKE